MYVLRTTIIGQGQTWRLPVKGVDASAHFHFLSFFFTTLFFCRTLSFLFFQNQRKKILNPIIQISRSNEVNIVFIKNYLFWPWRMWSLKKKHCQRHNGPRVLSSKLEWSFSADTISNWFQSEKLFKSKNSIPWVRCASGNVFYYKLISTQAMEIFPTPVRQSGIGFITFISQVRLWD